MVDFFEFSQNFVAFHEHGLDFHHALCENFFLLRELVVEPFIFCQQLSFEFCQVALNLLELLSRECLRVIHDGLVRNNRLTCHFYVGILLGACVVQVLNVLQHLRLVRFERRDR